MSKTRETLAPNREMQRLRKMLDAEGIGHEVFGDGNFCHTQQWDEDGMVFSAICGPHAYGEIELWTRSMRAREEDPIGLATAEEAMELIRGGAGMTPTGDGRGE